MKKVIMAAMCCMVAMATMAKEREYNIYYDEITNIRGELYLYSERYLGTTDVVLNDSHTYKLINVKQIVDNPTTTTTTTTTWKAQEKTTVKAQLPLSEETLMATNLAKKAESVAKQIYRIRETRMNILAGDVEHMPADGKAMQLVLDELDKQEEALTSMFVGKTIVKNHRKAVSINVSDTEKALQLPLIKFSEQEGVLSNSSDNGDQLTLNVTRKTEPVLAENQPKKGEPVYEDKIISSKTTITYQNKTIYEKTCNL